MPEQEFQDLIRIKNISDMDESEIEAYADMFLDRIEEQNSELGSFGTFWCPKCESPDAVVHVDEFGQRGFATCPDCRMAIIMVGSESPIDSEIDPDAL